MELFLRIAKPDENGVSRWVRTTEFVNEYEALKFGNGGSWCRASSSLAKKYKIELDKTLTSGNSIDAIRLNGFRSDESFNQNIRADIKSYHKDKNCVMLGIQGSSENTKIEIDHKDGRKEDMRVSDVNTQRLEDFQPLSKAANDAKRQICKRCRETGKRWDAKNLEGNPYSFYEGDENYTEELGCVGCYQFDPVDYRKQTVRRIVGEVSCDSVEYVMEKLYGDKV